jgi:prolipoprotein diacylglyceryltransferase
MIMDNAINKFLDHIALTRIILFHKSWPAFQFSVFSGVLLSALFTAVLIAHLGLSLAVAAIIFLTGAIAFCGTTLLAKMVTGKEVYVCYHNGPAALAAVLMALWVLDAPVLPYFDVIVLALGLGQAVGRAGCLMVGCCHGRPHRWGICYGEAHAAEGFTPFYVGVRLFPIQAVESLSVALIVAVSTVLLLTRQPPGMVAVWYLASYAAVRFYLEFMRGDSARSHAFGFSEAQWTSFLLLLAITLLGVIGAFDGWQWLLLATAGVALTMGFVVLRRRSDGGTRYRLLHPWHVSEIAQAVGAVYKCNAPGCSGSQPACGAGDVRVSRTSRGILISGTRLYSAAGPISVFAMSRCDKVMDRETASILARLILQLRHHAGSFELVQRHQCVFHLLLRGTGNDDAVITQRAIGIDA